MRAIGNISFWKQFGKVGEEYWAVNSSFFRKKIVYKIKEFVSEFVKFVSWIRHNKKLSDLLNIYRNFISVFILFYIGIHIF